MKKTLFARARAVFLVGLLLAACSKPALTEEPVRAVKLMTVIEQDRAVGIHAWEAIVESTVRRLRPIVLTAATAVLAMIPLSRSVFWGPMALAIMGGLVVATVLALLTRPAGTLSGTACNATLHRQGKILGLSIS